MVHTGVEEAILHWSGKPEYCSEHNQNAKYTIARGSGGSYAPRKSFEITCNEIKSQCIAI